MTGRVHIASLVRVTLTDFLVARSLETLDAGSCDYFLAGDRVICNCETIAEPVEQALDDLAMVRVCNSVFGPDNPIVAILADQYATHPEYDPGWHFLPRVGLAQQLARAASDEEKRNSIRRRL